MAVKYFNRIGDQITKEEYLKLAADPAYVTVKLYDNSVIRAEVKWLGRIKGVEHLFADYYPLFQFNVWNYADGRQVPDPVEFEKTFATEARAIDAYQTFLKNWTESGIDRFGDFKEVGNMAEPPKPDDPDVPETEPDDPALGGVGAW